jgi:nucleoside phosphorylase
VIASVRAVLAVVVAAAGMSAGPVLARSAPPPQSCVLVLAAMPLELNPLLARGRLDGNWTQQIDGRTFYRGTLAGVDTVLAMTGIGTTNAAQTFAAALRFRGCRIRGVVFSGVAGSKERIGDVTVAQRWTADRGRTWTPVDPAMLTTARRLPGRVALEQSTPVGDAACLCPLVEDRPTPVVMPHAPRVVVGGDGTTSDTYSGKALPCVPGGGDVFGCQPCLRDSAPADATTFAARAAGLLDPAFVSGFLTPPEQTTTTYAAQDQETATVAALARRSRLPFLGIRGVSDGAGDPLSLPGFPFTFFAYRNLAGNNAARVTVAFLAEWSRRGFPTATR